MGFEQRICFLFKKFSKLRRRQWRSAIRSGGTGVPDLVWAQWREWFLRDEDYYYWIPFTRATDLEWFGSQVGLSSPSEYVCSVCLAGESGRFDTFGGLCKHLFSDVHEANVS
jgi:hypothetical protein